MMARFLGRKKKDPQNITDLMKPASGKGKTKQFKYGKRLGAWR